MLSRFDAIPERDRQTDGQIDGRIKTESIRDKRTVSAQHTTAEIARADVQTELSRFALRRAAKS